MKADGRRNALTLVLGAITLAYAFALAGGAQKQSGPGAVDPRGEGSTGTGISEPTVAAGPVLSMVPGQTAGEVSDHPHPEVPVPPGEARVVLVPHIDPPTAPALDNDSIVPQAPADFRYQLVHDLTPAESPSRSTVHEPSVANMGNTIFWSANWYAARSSDGGNSFTYVSPYTTFPSVNGGFCCDQVVNYAPRQDMMLWALQYRKDAVSGTLRIARAVGSAAVAANTWVYYDFNPQMFGFASGNWMDFPNLTVGANFLYVTSNVFTTAGDFFSGSVVFRIPLVQLSSGGSITWNYFSRMDVGDFRCTEGAGRTMYWAAFSTTAQLRIHRWDDTSGTVLWDEVTLNPFAFMSHDGLAVSPDGTNWALRATTKVLGAWVSGGELGFMWAAKQDATFAYPYVIVGRFSESTRTLIAQTNIWNPGNAWLYPTASVNASGHVAGLLAYGGGALYPGTNTWISDDVQAGFSPLAVFALRESTDGPNRNAWGDYLTARPHRDFPYSWVAATFYMTPGGEDQNTVANYAWFGRERVLGGPSVYQGFLDAVGCGIITGWAWDVTQPNTPIGVDIYDGSTLIATVSANLFREDIRNAGIGNGFHGFSFSTPASLKDGVVHSIRVKFARTDSELVRSPRNLTCANTAVILQGFHDGAGCNTISGWAWNASDPNNPINVDIYDGVTMIATVPAIQFRPDLVTAGIGNGFHGFSFTVPNGLKDGLTHSIRVRFPGTTTDLQRTPRSIACNGAPPVYEGVHEVADCNVISGWAWDQNDPNSPINVAIFDGNQLIATVLAIQFRQALVDQGKGNGYHVFVYNVPASLKNSQPHSIRVRYSGSAVALSSTPRTINCPPP